MLSEMEINESAKYGTRSAVWSLQTDLERNILPVINFLRVKGPVYLFISSVVQQNFSVLLDKITICCWTKVQFVVRQNFNLL